MSPIVIQNSIARIRKLKGFTQEELADKLNVTRQTISSLENGKYNPSLDLIFRLMLLFQCEFNDLFVCSLSS